MIRWTLSIQDDLFGVQHPEDGSEFTASVFYIIATDERTGRRFAHDHSIKSAHAVSEYDADGEWFGGVASYRPEALAKAEALLAKMRAAQEAGTFVTPVGRAHWNEIYPVYGSPAYLGEV